MENLEEQETYRKENLNEVKKLAGKYFKAWKVRAYQTMHDLSTKTYQKRYPKNKTLQVRFPHKLNRYTILKVVPVSNVTHDVIFKCTYQGNDLTLYVRCIKEMDPYVPSESGEWGVNPISIR